MESLFVLQDNTLSTITKTLVNIKKSPKARLTITYVKVKLETLEKYWEDFRKTHKEILKIATSEQRSRHEYFVEDIYAKGEEEYITAKCEMKDILERMQPQHSAHQYNSGNTNQEVKLPKISIPQFNGNYNDWNTFQDLYLSLIHSNTSLSNIQKMHYLKTSLTGEAEHLLKHIPIADKNYDVAWDTLKERYNNRRVIVNTIFNRLLSQKKLTYATAKGIKDLLDITTECLNNLKNNDVKVDNWDPILIHIFVNKLDQESHKEWEEELKDLPVQELPTWKRFQDFLVGKFRVLEMVQPTQSKEKERPSLKTKSFHTAAPEKSSSETICTYCKGDHIILKCQEFLKQQPSKRSEFVKNERLCFNCLWPGHGVSYCRHKMTCHKCRRKHHTLLHETSPKNLEKTDTEPRERESKEETEASTPNILSHVSTQSNVTLLATALVNIRTSRGEQTVRALIDPCSQESFVSESTAQRLQLRKREIEGQVTGVGKMSSPLRHAVELEIASRLNSKFKLRCTAFVVKQVTEIMPAKKINNDKWIQFTGLQLADPGYCNPGSIDILLGVGIYTEILMTGIIKGNTGVPSVIAQQTQFGWIISGGGAQSEHSLNRISVSMNLNVSLDTMLQRFWEVESLEHKNALTALDVRAERIYEQTRRQADGRYIVSLPFRTDNPSLPENSRAIALKRFKSLENRLDYKKHREEYNKVMHEYLELEHMELVRPEQMQNKAVYLPHHAVIREDKETSKVRVVFDASCKGTNGISLNDELLIGPSLQEELRNIIMRWRLHKICFVADIVKMYRQIRVRQEDCDYQRILYRFNPKDEIRDYRLLTVTFGTACAPYLAMKTLKQVALDESKDGKYPLAKDIVLRDFYMDDVLAGSDNEETAIEMQRQLTEVLQLGGFELQKWSSNSKKFLQTLAPERIAKASEIDMHRKDSIRTLGIIWDRNSDNLRISQKKCSTGGLTKRDVLRHIASLFDPMGWLAPAVITAKVFMQKLWVRKLEWDEELPGDLRDEWKSYRDCLPCLSEIRIDRWVGYSNNCIVEVHGFSDASLAGYAAVVYLRILNSDGKPNNVSLVTAKTKVAPVKTLTLPRLELCGAVLLAKLVRHVMKTLNIELNQTFAWTDSKIVLSWIQGDPNRWTPFVKNRVIEIRNELDTHWSYVNTKENPADPASRGICPSQLKTCELWWKGPQFLHEDGLTLPTVDIPETEEEKRISVKCAMINVTTDEIESKITLLKKYSSLTKLLHVVAYCRRWKNLKRKEKLPKHITSQEKEEALTVCLKIAQEIEFPDEVANLKKKKAIKTSSRLLPLNPYLDDDGVVRVGGRLKHAKIEFNRKHPIIITKDNVLLPLLLREAHLQTLHGGYQLMSTYLRSKYWIIKGGQSIKRYYRKCILCARYNATAGEQMMGDLPDVRVTPSRAFSVSGVDFAGPITSRMSKGRGAKTYKSYICLFICMATKAIHLELVSDMTTEAFIAAFKRFVSRRGHCKELWSDHGTTFVSSEKTLLEMWRLGRNELPVELQSQLDNRGTRWKYIPPGAPNFGGLWEAGVKSTKYHLKRLLKNSTLTFEELYTVLTQIEACLNSRPITEIGEDLDYLTPGHFLIGEAMVTIPDRNYDTVNMNNLTRWQLIQRTVQNFWNHWQSEYLSRLQQRPKWLKQKNDVEVGQLVLIKDSRLPPAEWQLGRVIKKYEGKDGLTRMNDVRTSNGVKQRAITKLCHLPD